MKCLVQTVLLLIVAATSLVGQTPQQPPDLTALEENVGKQFNELRVKSGLKPLKFRRDLRIRMEACSVETQGPDPKVEQPGTKYKIWYLTTDPIEPPDDLARLVESSKKTDRRHVAVGVWFATTGAYPNGAYWVVVYPEVSVAHEAFWTHFPLIDEGHYDNIFDKRWKKGLRERCRSLK